MASNLMLGHQSPVEGHAHQEIGQQDGDVGEGGEEQPPEKAGLGQDLDLPRQGGAQGKISHHDHAQEGQKTVQEQSQDGGGPA